MGGDGLRALRLRKGHSVCAFLVEIQHETSRVLLGPDLGVVRAGSQLRRSLESFDAGDAVVISRGPDVVTRSRVLLPTWITMPAPPPPDPRGCALIFKLLAETCLFRLTSRADLSSVERDLLSSIESEEYDPDVLDVLADSLEYHGHTTLAICWRGTRRHLGP